MSSRIIIIGLALATLGLAACATPDPGSPEAYALAQKKAKEERVAAVKDTADEMPSWYLSPPTDATSLYGPGTAVSGDLQLALDKATLNAKHDLAARLNGTLSSKFKQFVSESGAAEDALVLTETERVTQSTVAEVNLAGYQLKERKVQPQGTQYRAYVLVQYPLGNANRVLMDQVKKNQALESKLRASKAFQDLESEIKTAKDKP